jgi:hypothetical protein
MKSLSRVIGALIFLAIQISSALAQETITIGAQVWMSKNLDVDNFRVITIMILQTEQSMANSTIGMLSMIRGVWLLKDIICQVGKSCLHSMNPWGKMQELN